MLKIFRKNQFLRSILLLPVALILNVNLLLFASVDIPLYHTPIDQLLSDFRISMPVLHWLAFSFMLFGGAVLLNRMVIINRLSNTISLYPGLFYLVLMSALPVFGALTSISISLFIFILLLSNLMYINARTGVATKIFNVGLYLGLMSMLFLPQLSFVFLIFIAIRVLTAIRQREIFNLMNGTLLPFYMSGLVLLFIGFDIGGLKSVYSQQFGFENLRLPQDIPSWASLIFIALYLVVVLLTYNGVISKKSIQSIRKINIVTWALPFAVLIYLISGKSSLHLLMLTVPILAFYTSEGVLRFKKESNAEMILILLVVLCIVMPFF